METWEMEMKYQAHRGVSEGFPENTMPAFRAAAAYGYDYIETDPHFTADGRCVLIHDCELNRTCRTKDGEELPRPVIIEKISYQEALGYDAGIAVSPRFRGTKIPLLEELLEFAKRTGIAVKIDNRFQSFTDGQLDILFRLVRASRARVAFTCSDLRFARLVHDRLPDCELHYDGYVDEERVREMAAIAGSPDFYVWLGLPTPKIAWVTVPTASPALCSMVKRYGHLGIWILTEREELEQAHRLGAELIETTGSLKPPLRP